MSGNRSVTTQDFQPTPAMTVWLDTAVENLSNNVVEIAEKCNISRQTYYRWMKNDGFRLWFRDEWEKTLVGIQWKLDIIGLRKARIDFRYWRSMQDRIGNIPRPPKIHKINVAIKDYDSQS